MTATAIFTGRNLWRIFFTVTSLAIALVSMRFLALGMATAFPNMLHHIQTEIPLFYVHVVTGPLALVLAPLQFSKKIRAKMPAVHRWIGRTYCLCVLAGGIAGLVMAVNSTEGIFAQSGFFILAVLWLSMTGLALTKARQRKFVEHRKWMIRSVAMTFGAVTLRIELPILMVAGTSFEVAYSIVAWSSWALNLAVVEYYFRRSSQRVSVPA